MAQETPAKQLYDLLISRDFDDLRAVSSQTDKTPVNAEGQPDVGLADLFSFDWHSESGKNYGTVLILLRSDGTVMLEFGNNLGKTIDSSDRQQWFDFMLEIKNFAVRNFMAFEAVNLGKIRHSLHGQRNIREGLLESWTGRRDVSWNADPGQTRLVIKHRRALGEGEARHHQIESLFVETADDQRFRLPFRNLTAGRAMLEHVRAGGRPWDVRGAHIAQMVSEIAVLSRFRRANTGRLLEGDTATLVEQTNGYYTRLQRCLRGMTTATGYRDYFESWQPTEISEESVVIEGLKHLFVTQTIDQRIEDALPLLARIQQQEKIMKEADIFESWASRLVEGTWQLPDTPEKQTELIELLSQELSVGVDAVNATGQLQNILGDDELFDQLSALATTDPNADARQVVIDRLQQLSDDPDVRRVLDQLQIDPTAEMNPPEAVNPADLEPEQPGMAEDQGDECPVHGSYGFPNLQADESACTCDFDKLANPSWPDLEMDEGDDQLDVAQNTQKLTDGWKGTLAGSAAGGIAGEIAGKALGPAAGAALGGAVGGVPGAIAGGAAGAVAGPAIGSAIGSLAGGKIGDKLSGQDTNEESPTATVVKGAMKAATQGLSLVGGARKEAAKHMIYQETDQAKDTSFLDRLKKLSGQMK